MSNEDAVPDLGFFAKEPFALRAIDQEWLNKRANELGNMAGPDLDAALDEVLADLYARMGVNLDKGRCSIIHSPGDEGDPYIIAVPIIKPNSRIVKSMTRKVSTEAMLAVADAPRSAREKVEESLRLQFEEMVSVLPEGLGHHGLVRTPSGRYVDQKFQGMWEGFLLYHDGMTTIGQGLPGRHDHRIMGHYVVGKVVKTGVAIFTKAPYRHATKAGAMEECLRLKEEFNETFAIFRCVDVVPHTNPTN